ncbi:MAG TPA: phytanoyl-CoA dioxygenase family protein [Acidimicrobiia bacterium]
MTTSAAISTAGRFARDDEVATWRDQGWILLDGLISTDEIDATHADLALLFPTAEEFHSDPEGVEQRWIGKPARPPEVYTWPDEGPGFRPEQHYFQREFPFGGEGLLNRLYVHPALVDFAERALGTDDIRLYQNHATAKYAGFTNYEQPMHSDRNHSWLPAATSPPWLQLQVFVYLNDVSEGNAATHIVSRGDERGHKLTEPLVLPNWDREIYAAEQSAPGVRGSVLAYGSNVFHRGVDLIEPGTARFTLNVCFKRAGHDWIGYHAPHSKSTSGGWVAFAEQCTPRELALFGFPEPGHPIWTAELLDSTAELYPKLDLTPWRAALSPAG